MNDTDSKAALYAELAAKLASRAAEVDEWVERDPNGWHQWCRLDAALVAGKTDPAVTPAQYRQQSERLLARFCKVEEQPQCPGRKHALTSRPHRTMDPPSRCKWNRRRRVRKRKKTLR